MVNLNEGRLVVPVSSSEAETTRVSDQEPKQGVVITVIAISTSQCLAQ